MPGKQRSPRPEGTVTPTSPAPAPPGSPATEPPTPPINVLIIDRDLAAAQRWGPILRTHNISVCVAADLHRVRTHVRRHAATLDAIVFDLVVPGGEPSDILSAVTTAASPCGLVLATRESARVASNAAARLRADVVLLTPVGESAMLDALGRAKAIADLRRTPTKPDHLHEFAPQDLSDHVLDLILVLLDRAGLEHPHGRQAISMRARGMTDQGAAALSGVSESRIRSRVAAALRELGADDAYALLGVLARQISEDLGSVATTRGISGALLFADLRETIDATGPRAHSRREHADPLARRRGDALPGSAAAIR